LTPETVLALAILAQVGLAFLVLFILGRRRLPRVGRGEIRLADIALSGEAWPDDARQASNNFDNQFQIPVLFYVVAGLTLYLGAGWAEAALAWAFVATRCLHSAIHLSSNNVRHRFMAYVGGFALVVAMWLAVVVRVGAGALAGGGA